MAIAILVVIHVLGGLSLAGVSLALDNFGMKLAPNDEAIVYISTRNIVVALMGAFAPMLGGLLADMLATQSVQLSLPIAGKVFHILHLQGWSFLFLGGGLLAIASLRLLYRVAEEGETERSVAVGHMRVAFRSSLQANWNREALLNLVYYPVLLPVMLGKKVQQRFTRRIAIIRGISNSASLRRSA